MGNETGMTLNSRDFDRTFPRVTEKDIPQDVADAYREVVPLILKDAIMEDPRVPHKTGNLWRSQKIEIPKIERGQVTIEFGFNADYAAYVHEMPEQTNWTMDGSGPKFLESKLSRNGSRYFERIAEKVRAKGTARET